MRQGGRESGMSEWQYKVLLQHVLGPPPTSRVRYLRQCAEVMSSVGRRWKLKVLMDGWADTAAGIRRRRSDECRGLVLVRAAFK